MKNLSLASVNIGVPTRMKAAKVNGFTGIFKQPVLGLHTIETLGLAGDAVCDTKNHGGPGQAIYVYGEADYAWWAGELSAELAPGTFGENLTIAGLESAAFSIGDKLVIGDAVVLQVSAPRIPCGVLAQRMEDNGFVKKFRAAERPGLYCRVIQQGSVQAGMPVHVVRYSGPTLGIVEMFRDYYEARWTREKQARHLAAPIADRARQDALDKALID
jgi:MOSC domain-containing protein YiiM